MSQTRQLNIRTLLISIFLFIIGQFLFVKFFEFFEPKFDLLTFKVVENRNGLRTSILFSLMLFLIPILVLATWRLSPIISTRKKFISYLIVIISITVAIWMRHVEVKAYYTYLF